MDQNQKHTRNTLAEFIQGEWESDLPDRVLEALRPYDGKPITTRLIDKLPGGKDVWRLRRAYGMTHVENRDYWSTQGNSRNGVCLLLAHTEASVPLNVAYMVEKSPAYFKGRIERNHARMEARNDGDRLDRLANVMNRIEALQAALAGATAEFGKLTDYGTVFYPDRYDLEHLCGLREESK